MHTPLPTQLSGAKFLAERQFALLADLPRVGKTGAAVIAADYIMAENILVVTTASGRGVLRAGFEGWGAFKRRTQVISSGNDKLNAATSVAIVGWAGIVTPTLRVQLLRRRWDLVILDECHNAKNFQTKRTQAAYGTLIDDGAVLNKTSALLNTVDVNSPVWLLSGTPLPNNPAEAYPMMRALCRERLAADPARGWPDVMKQADFIERYCKMRPMRIGRGWAARSIQVFVEGRNLSELRARLAGFFMQRTQADVGIMEPDYETMPLIVSASARADADFGVKRETVLAAAERGDTKSLDMHMGPLRRLTGEIKAQAIVGAVKEELEGGLDKIVLAYWHKDVGKILLDGLAKFGVTGIDGSTPAKTRVAAERRFLNDPKCRVFLGQIQAAGEAIDLSAAAQLIFVETSFTPKDMKQMSLRITNHGQKRKPLVRVATLEGSIDDALQQILLRKWSAIREVLAA